MALFVFGAGATRGCSFVDATQHSCLPPLDADFFTQLQRVQNPKHFDLIQKVMEDTVTLFGNNFKVTMETVFTTLEHTIAMVETTGERRDFTIEELKEKRERLLQAIITVLEDSLTPKTEMGRSTLTPYECEHHKKFIQDIAKKGDDIITYNYDCVLDYALKNYGSEKWNPRYGYCFNLGPRGKYIEGDKHWEPDDVSSREDTMKLLKLHGSLHFKIGKKVKNGYISLKQRPYTKQNGNMKFTIIPPEWHKQFAKGVFKDLWNSASTTINKARALVIVGYSLPITDSHATALFSTSVKKDRLKSIVIVNPDKSARERTRSILHRGINKKTKVLSFDYFPEFLSCDRSVWDR